MVRDTLSNAALYLPLDAGIARALRFLADGGHRALVPDERHDLGDGVVATAEAFDTRRREDGTWEAHRKHIDVQCVIEGLELMGHAPIGALRAQPYDETRDVLFAEGDGDFFHLSPGGFAIFWPADAHMPGMATGAPAPLRKVVIKVPVRVRDY